MDKKLNSTNKENPNFTLDIYKNIFENSFDGIILIDNSYNHIDVNQSACSLLGYSKTELINMSLRDLVQKSSVQHGKNLWNELLEKGRQKGEYTLLKKNGKEINIEYHALANIAPGIHLFFMKDVTEKKRIELNILKERELWFSILNDLPAYVCIQDPNLEIIFANKNLEENFGPIEGRKCHEIFFGDKDKSKEPCSSCTLYKLFEGTDIITSEKTYINGKTYFVYDYSFVDIENNKYVLEIGFDITERKLVEKALEENERALRGIFAASPVGINLIQNEGIAWSNDMMCQITGYSKDELIGKNTRFLYLSDEDYKKASYDYNKKFAEGKIPKLDTKWKRKDGKIIDVHKKMSLLDPNDPSKGYISSVMDITERKHVEEQLSATNKQLEEIIEFLPDATVIIDKNKKILAWNRAMEEMTGLPKEGILGKNHEYTAVPFYGKSRKYLVDLIFENNLEVRSKYNFVEQKGKSLYAEVFAPALYNNKGGYIWVIASPLLDQNGNVIGAIEAIRDITERIKAEESLKESKEKYKELADSLPEIVFETDKKGNLLFVNRNAFNITGYTKEDVERGVNVVEFIIPEERERLKENIQKLLSGVEIGGSEYTALKKDGSTFSIIIHSNVIVHRGKPIGLRGIIFDITEKMKAEEKIIESERTLRTILTAAPVGIKLVQNRQILWCNNSMIKMTGYNFDELKNKNLKFLYHREEDYDKIGQVLYEKWADEEYREVETLWIRKNGELMDCHLRISPVDRNDFGKGMIEIITDITESKKAQKQLDENLEYFAHLIDHIRNPLAIISGFIQLEADIERIKDRVQRQVNRIEEILLQLDQGWMDTEDTRNFLKKYK